MEQKILAQMCFSFSTEEKAQTAFKSMEPEFSQKHEKRANTTASIKKNILAFSINAEDLAAMKASMLSNSRSVTFINSLINGGFG